MGRITRLDSDTRPSTLSATFLDIRYIATRTPACTTIARPVITMATTSNVSIDPPYPIRRDVQLAGLRYVSDAMPGIRRTRRGKAFRYTGPTGRPIHDKATLDRVRKLAIPPAW